jgi:hypothetical protein
MKRITTLLVAALFTLSGVAQDKINWLTTSKFEKALKKEKQNYFIFIEDNRVPNNISAEQIKERKKIMFAFLEDANLVSYINNNFICYKFNPSSESLNFQGEEYWKIVKNGRTHHEFTNFLAQTEGNRLPVIVLRDQNFNLFEYFEYQASSAEIEEIKVLIDAEKLKINFISGKLGPNNKNVKKSEQMLEKHTDKLKAIQENKESKSVFLARQNAKRFLKMMTYFSSGACQKTDLDSFLKSRQSELQ